VEDEESEEDAKGPAGFLDVEAEVSSDEEVGSDEEQEDEDVIDEDNEEEDEEEEGDSESGKPDSASSGELALVCENSIC